MTNKMLKNLNYDNSYDIFNLKYTHESIYYVIDRIKILFFLIFYNLHDIKLIVK